MRRRRESGWNIHGNGIIRRSVGATVNMRKITITGAWRKVFFKKKNHDFISISVSVNEFDMEEEYKKVLDFRDAMRASTGLVDEKWVELMEQSKENLVVVFSQ